MHFPFLAVKKQGPHVFNDISSLRAYRNKLTKQGKILAFVPTMGALHDGHLSLMKLGQKEADHVIASIFVNPTQFGPNEDFSRYPRTWDADLAKLASIGVDAVFAPDVPTMYPGETKTTVHVDGLTEGLCGPIRPGHFDGVATVVSKLFNLVQPDLAIFGEKDFQQLQVIRKMTKDLNMPVHIIGAPTVRDENGLAMSSRNAYLTSDEYKTAISLNKIIFATAARFRAGEAAETLIKQASADILRAGFASLDYLEICDAETLQPIQAWHQKDARVIVAARLGKTRLIDNVAV